MEGELGNCWQACVATLLGLSMEEVPDYVDDYVVGEREGDNWLRYWDRFTKWLADRGFVVMRQFHAIQSISFTQDVDGVPFIVGDIANDGQGHACVCCYRHDEAGKPRLEILHDPYREHLISRPIDGKSTLYAARRRIGTGSDDTNHVPQFWESA